MTNDRRRLIEHVLIVTMICGSTATAWGQGASAEAGRTSPADAWRRGASAEAGRTSPADAWRWGASAEAGRTSPAEVVAPAAIAGAPGAAEAVAEPETEVDPEAEAPEAAEEAEAAEAEQGQEADVAELERRIDVLAEEIELLRSGEDDRLDVDEARRLGLAPSASATYAIDQGVSIAGYGEMLLENYADSSGKTTQFDYLRAILYAGYRFNDKFLFNSEIEVEHAKEIFVEFAYVDYQATENFGLRGGMLLVPMGLVNEFHEPTVFMGAERPVTENRIIPSTWRENGGGFYGAFDQVSFRAYVLNGFNGSSFSSGGLRGGRQKGGKAKSTSLAYTGRLDITPTPGVFFGASFYAGDSGQGEIVVDGTEYGIGTTIFDLHGQAQVRGFDLRALMARASLSDAAMLNMALGKSGSSGVGSGLAGQYIQIGYDLLSQVPEAGGVGLTPYVRYETVDTQAEMPAGFERSLSTDNTYFTFGIELKPNPGIVLKVDHAWVSNDANSGVNQFNINLGYAF